MPLRHPPDKAAEDEADLLSLPREDNEVLRVCLLHQRRNMPSMINRMIAVCLFVMWADGSGLEIRKANVARGLKFESIDIRVNCFVQAFRWEDFVLEMSVLNRNQPSIKSLDYLPIRIPSPTLGSCRVLTAVPVLMSIVWKVALPTTASTFLFLLSSFVSYSTRSVSVASTR